MSSRTKPFNFLTANGRHHALRLIIFPEQMLGRLLRERFADELMQTHSVNPQADWTRFFPQNPQA